MFSDPLSLFAAEAVTAGAVAEDDGRAASGVSTVNVKKSLSTLPSHASATDEITVCKNKSLAEELADYERSVLNTGVTTKSASAILQSSQAAGTTTNSVRNFERPNYLNPPIPAAMTSDRSDAASSNSIIVTVGSNQQHQTPTTGVPTVTAVSIPQDIENTDDDIELLTGETNLMRLKNVSIQKPSGRHIPITLIMTTFRMMLVPSRSHSIALAGSNPSILSQLNVPLGCIEKIEREKKAKDSRVQGTTIIIHCKDIRSFRLYISGPDEQIHDGPPMSDSEIERAFNAMGAYAFPTDIRYVFAFVHFHALPTALKAVEPHLTYDCVVCNPVVYV